LIKIKKKIDYYLFILQSLIHNETILNILLDYLSYVSDVAKLILSFLGFRLSFPISSHLRQRPSHIAVQHTPFVHSNSYMISIGCHGNPNAGFNDVFDCLNIILK